MRLLWGGTGEEAIFHLVSWDKIFSPLSGGWLGFRKLCIFNKALLGKWLWMFHHKESDSLCTAVTDSKYGRDKRGWGSKEAGGNNGVVVWKNIRRGWDVFVQYIIFLFGDWARICFWHDPSWCGGSALRAAFPDWWLTFWIVLVALHSGMFSYLEQ